MSSPGEFRDLPLDEYDATQADLFDFADKSKQRRISPHRFNQYSSKLNSENFVLQLNEFWMPAYSIESDSGVQHADTLLKAARATIGAYVKWRYQGDVTLYPLGAEAVQTKLEYTQRHKKSGRLIGVKATDFALTDPTEIGAILHNANPRPNVRFGEGLSQDQINEMISRHQPLVDLVNARLDQDSYEACRTQQSQSENNGHFMFVDYDFGLDRISLERKDDDGPFITLHHDHLDDEGNSVSERYFYTKNRPYFYRYFYKINGQSDETDMLSGFNALSIDEQATLTGLLADRTPENIINIGQNF